MTCRPTQGEDLTLKTDVFSFGTILWEFATERIPHFQVRDNLQALAEAISGQGPQPKFSGDFAALTCCGVSTSQYHSPPAPVPGNSLNVVL
jgi:hypothetical protein